MILRHTGTWLQATITHDAEGQPVKSWSILKIMACDVQPANLNENQMALFGITDQTSSVKKVFFEKDDTIIEGLRLFTGGKLYDVRGSNEWSIHNVILAIPVIGETYAGI